MFHTIKIIFALLSTSALLAACKPSDVEDYDPCEGFTVSIVQEGSSMLKTVLPAGWQTALTYEWSTAASLGVITADTSGTYSVTVRDLQGCTASASYKYTSQTCSPSTVNDNDGNIYDVVTIGSQCWMKQNLKVSAGIPEVADSMAWMTATGAGSPAWCWPQNSSANSSYGKLYNWYAIGAGNLCPNGWHIPTMTDWQTLISFLGGDQVAGGKMKAEGTSYWNSPNGGATNSSGFTAVGAGDRSNQSLFGAFGLVGLYWSATSTQHTATVVYMNNSAASVLQGERTKQAAYSCRCVKD